jgi:CRISPR/Cas system CMR-associated protein Cmr3 (group 5 of RAMP superfamily)
MALRYATSGFNHQILVPRTQTANNLLDFFKTHRTQTELAEREQLHRQLGVWVAEDTGGKENPFAKDYDVKENDRIIQTSPRVNDKCEMPWVMRINLRS